MIGVRSTHEGRLPRTLALDGASALDIDRLRFAVVFLLGGGATVAAAATVIPHLAAAAAALAHLPG